MSIKTVNTQAGFTSVIEIALIVLVLGAVGFTGVRIKQTQDNNKSQAAQAEKDKTTKAELQKAQDLKKAADAAKLTTPVVAATQPAAVEPNTVTSTPAPKPIAAVSSATKFTSANCTGNVSVYVSNKSGTTGSYQPPASWLVVKNYAYAQKLDVYCVMSEGGTSYAPDYVLENDAFVKSSDLSPTKP